MARNRKRTTRGRALRVANAVARERQAAWLATGHPNLTERQTTTLDRCYAEVRAHAADGPDREPTLPGWRHRGGKPE